MKYKDVTNPRQQQLDEIARIEGLARPHNWQAARDFYLKLHPEFKLYEKEFIEACKELRFADNNVTTGATKSGSMRNTMKIPPYVYRSMQMFDKDLQQDLSGKNGNDLEKISKQLWKAFPEYQIARAF